MCARTCKRLLKWLKGQGKLEPNSDFFKLHFIQRLTASSFLLSSNTVPTAVTEVRRDFSSSIIHYTSSPRVIHVQAQLPV
jgi:hypothetical protein